MLLGFDWLITACGISQLLYSFESSLVHSLVPITLRLVTVTQNAHLNSKMCLYDSC